MNEKFKGAREWKDEFSFLTRNGFDHLYLMLLGMARSKADIKRFHNLLNADMRLLRPDLIKLESFWEKYIFPEIKTTKDRQFCLDDVTSKWLFACQVFEKSNLVYYANYLETKKGVSDRDLASFESYQLSLVTGNKEMFRKANFNSSILGIDFPTECFIARDKKTVIVCLEIHYHQLDEELTYRFGKMPGYVLTEHSTKGIRKLSPYIMSRGYSAETIYLNITVSDIEIDKLSIEFLDKFAYYLKDRLVAMGLPISSLISRSCEGAF